jgi:vitamin B12 transporter
VHSVSGKDNDSIISLRIQEVCIYQTRNTLFKDDKFFYRLDSLTLLRHQNSNLGELIEKSTPAIINHYGSTGSLSTLSFRGTGANHSQVSWNGFPLNALSTGQMDLSLAGSDIADQVTVVSTATGAIYGSGTIGGAIELNNYANWHNIFNIKINSELGLFDKEKSANPFEGKPGNIDSKSLSFNLKFGNKKVQSATVLFNRNALNKFPYIDYMSLGNPVGLQGHNKYNSSGIVQNFYFRLNNYQELDAGLWLQRKYYEIPAQIGSAFKSNKSQRDSTFKIYLKWQWAKGQNGVSIKSGWFYDFLHYNSDTLDSRISGKKWMNDINYRRQFNNYLTLDGGFSYYLLKAPYNLKMTGGSFLKEYSEYWYSAYSDIRINLKRSIIDFSIRKDFLDGYDPLPQLSLGANYKLNQNIIFKANISNKFRQPTFNEKYWPGSGNPDLKPEQGWGFDAGTEVNFTFLNILNKIVVTGYSDMINNWIQWMAPVIIPVNCKQVWARGVETLVEQTLPLQKNKLSWSIKYNYTPTTTTKSYISNPSILKKQLMLVPVHSFNGDFSADMHSFIGGISIIFRGKRYDSNDETGVPLYSYALVNLYFGKTFKYKLNRFIVDLKINNLFDKQYELISAYPMPGRAFYISVTYLLNQSN